MCHVPCQDRGSCDGTSEMVPLASCHGARCYWQPGLCHLALGLAPGLALDPNSLLPCCVSSRGGTVIIRIIVIVASALALRVLVGRRQASQDVRTRRSE